MQHQARLEALVDFLLPYQDIWRNEIMLSYPTPLKGYPPEWIEALRPLVKSENITALLKGQGWAELGGGLAPWFQRLTELVDFPQHQSSRKIEARPQSWVHIIPKKQHEIEAIAPAIVDTLELQGLKRIVDIGGGQGHLAQTLAHHFDLPVLSLDMDPELQRIGEHWQEIKWSDSSQRVAFKCHKIERQDRTFASLLDANTLTTGLHTCGPLAVAHLEASVLAGSSVWNMPCCYQKLAVADTNLSRLARGKGIEWNQFALTLASGAYLKANLADVEYRTLIKRKRYVLHFLLHDHLNTPGLVRLGNSPQELYQADFATYAREQLRRLDLSIDWSDEELNRYAARSVHEELIQEMLAAGIIREMFSRPLEALLLTDRALWLEEQGYEVKIEQVFDAEISPRNLVVWARPRTSSRS